jgi:hypothetical protein
MLSNSCRNDCFGHTFLVTVINTGALLRALRRVKSRREEKLWGFSRPRSVPVIFVSEVIFVHESQALRPACDRGRADGAITYLDDPQFNYEPFNSNSVNIRSWSWNYRGCWHQTCPPIVTRCWMGLDIPHCKLPNATRTFGRPISFRCLTICFGIGQFARLLPSVEVVAISQAPSPESNPNPPLPSKPWQSTTRPSLADRAVVHQNTPTSRLSQNELSQHFLCFCRLTGIGFSFIHSQGASRHVSEHAPWWKRPLDSCINLAFRQDIQCCGDRKIFAADYV